MGPLFAARILDVGHPLVFASGVVRDPILIPAEFGSLAATDARFRVVLADLSEIAVDNLTPVLTHCAYQSGAHFWIAVT
jgi:hypothetical protein